MREARRLTAGSGVLLLIPILLLAAALRLHAVDWDDGFHLHPDERFIAMVVGKIKLPTSIGAYFDTAHSPLNPYNNDFQQFAYGTLPLFLGRFLGALTGFEGYDRAVPLGRALSALFDVGTVLLVFLIGRRVYGVGVGLLGALVSALCVLQIQLAHFYAFDTFVAFFTAWSLYFAYRAWETRRAVDFVLLGVGIGCAVASKISALALLGLLVPPVLLLPWPGRPWTFPRRFVGDGLIAGLATLLTYRIAEPYAFLGTSPFDFAPNPRFVDDMANWVKISSGQVEVPYMLQWTGTTPMLALESIVRWGLGPAAGVASLVGLGLAAWRLRDYERGGRALLLIVWTAVNLVYFGTQFAKFMRYLLPVYPSLAVLAGWIAVEAWRAAGRRAEDPIPAPLGRLRPLGKLVAPLVVAGSAVWALAFVQIYGEPNTRVTASRWILDNVPAGASLATEHWDDALPLSLPGKDGRNYRDVSMPLYDDDNPDKLRKIVDNLSKADYVILASNRLYGSIPRLPQRYPMTIEYYRLLFSGALGFEPAAVFTDRPSVLGFEIVDDNAQEDFTVYDHPKVTIFRKTAAFDSRQVAQQLGAVPLDRIVRGRPSQAPSTQPVLTSAEWLQARVGGTWWQLFDRDSLANQLPLPAWWVMAALLGFAVWPLLWWLLPGLGPGAFGLARLSGLLLVSYLAWLAASLKMAPFGQTSLGAFLAMLLASSALLVTRRRLAFRSHLERSWRFIVAAEAVFTVAFAIGVALRMANPDLWHPSYGGEKPMDFAFLNAVVKSDYFPPYDPWFAGGSINYYYFGFVLVAALVKLTGIVPSVAYNLAIALWLAMTAQVAFTLAYCLYSRGRFWRGPVSKQALLAGALATLFVCLIGNLDGALQFRDALWKSASFKFESAVPLLGGLVRVVAGLPAALRNGNLAEFDFWRSTRVIGPEEPGPITEFPFFTVLYGDLHAHLLALPLTILAACLALELLRARTLAWLAASPRRLAEIPLRWEAGRIVLVMLFLATVLGALRATNTWDFPTYLLIGALALGIALRPLKLAGVLPRLLLAGGLALFVFGASSVLFGLYLDRYQLGYTGVEPVKAHTNVVQFLTINGFWLFILTSWIAVELTSRAGDRFRVGLPDRTGYFGGLAVPAPVEWSLETRWGGPAIGVALVALVLSAAGYATLALLLVLGAALVALAVLRWQSGGSLFTIALAGLALAVMAVPEVVNLQGDVGRMNTVFKFYYQAWTLLAVVSACLVVRLTLGPLARWMASPGWRCAWLAGLALLSAAVLVYPLRAPAVKLPLRFTPLAPTLDGMAYMEHATYRDKDKDLSLDADYQAIRWLQDNIVGTPVILEAQTGLYKWGSRVSIYTGLPTVIGWDWHEKQQRVTMGDRVDERLRDVKVIYESPRMDQALPLLKKYDVSYIYVGPLERTYYAAAGLKKLEEAPLDVLKPVYQANQVTIYQVVAR